MASEPIARDLTSSRQMEDGIERRSRAWASALARVTWRGRGELTA